MRRITSLIGALSLLVFAALLARPATASGFETGTLTIETASGARHDFTIEIARSSQEQAQGLMYRRVVPDGYGMLFDLGTAREATFWMRNTYVSLDMLFVKGDGSIHRIAHATEPLSDRLVSSHGDVVAVFEVVAGTTDRLNIQVGDVLHHALFDNAE